jgi:hypothetical protein
VRYFQILHDLQDTTTSLDGIIELEIEMRSVLQDDAFGQFSLKHGAMFTEFRQDARFLLRIANDTDKDVALAKVRRDIDRMERHQGLRAKVNFARDDFAQLPLDDLVYPFKSMFHDNLEMFYRLTLSRTLYPDTATE